MNVGCRQTEGSYAADFYGNCCKPRTTPPASAHDTAIDAALDCAALLTLSGQILAADGQASDRDLAQVSEISSVILLHSTLPNEQHADALHAYVAEYRNAHSDEEISQDVQREGDGCITKFVH